MCGRYNVIDGPLVQDLLETLGLEGKRWMFPEWLTLPGLSPVEVKKKPLKSGAFLLVVGGDGVTLKSPVSQCKLRENLLAW